MADIPRIPDPMAALFASVHQNTDAHRRRTGDDGYVRVYLPSHPYASRPQGEVLEHRLVMEKMVGRFLYSTEEVHHRDLGRANNHPDNLELHIDKRSHMAAHSKGADPAIVERVRLAAADPSVRYSDLRPLAPATIRRICRDNGFEWVSADEVQLTEDQVREALEGRTTDEAAALLGCSHQTLRNRFPHLIRQRRRPGFLDHHKARVIQLAEKQGVQAAATEFSCPPATIYAALRRWEKSPPGNRNQPGFLEAHRVRVCDLICRDVPLGKIAQSLSTTATSLNAAILRWSELRVLPTAVADRLNANSNRKHRLRGMDEPAAETPA
jgi:hypothetical protein